MKGFKLSDNLDHVMKIMTGINKKDGHCPCRINKDETTLCPCNEFIEDGKCVCKLFIKIEGE